MRRFLLIDDDEHEFMFINFLLKDRYEDAFTLEYVSTIEDAESCLSRNGVDKILLDDKLGGGMTSADTIPKLQKCAFNVPIIVISKDTSGAHLQDRAKMGTNQIVDKFGFRSELENGLLD
ncbi:response regulator [uncultured Algimonas sp.]|uniref:response regulator n=1 Tax=uncultured Algimonas sp. TaxID=1547920 RepID=UPI0026218327|nr:response regulator [uncultured Algimonas sp.]